MDASGPSVAQLGNPINPMHPWNSNGGETEPKAHFSLVSLRNSYWLALCNICNGPPLLVLCLTHRSMYL